MSDAANTSKDPEEEKIALTGNNDGNKSTDEQTQVDVELNETDVATSEAKVRHDPVK
ncbi:MAG TPA: hypothetical protein VFT90_01615 [Chryseosolibacter sp.]|nr:hypothetical protein [Chryseosolibacter sp.]